LPAACALECSPQDWNDLKTTWGLNPFSSIEYASQPRTTSDENMKGFVLMDNACTEDGSPFAGQRYMTGGDPALVLLYDVNGLIAGMQTMLPDTQFTPLNGKHTAAFVHYKGFWVLTAYFVDPSTICSTGRTSEQLASDGTGTGLWFQTDRGNVTIPTMVIATQQTAIPAPWLIGHCFYTMGEHFWYDYSLTMSCSDFFPFFTLYNKGALTGWGFATNYDNSDNSARYEHPTASVISSFMNPAPQCFSTDPAYKTLSTMHVWFKSDAFTHSNC
jgi:hypothetical protein